MEWFYEKRDTKEKHNLNESENYDKFVEFLANETNENVNDMNIYHLDSEGDDTDDGDIIDDCGDFEQYFDDHDDDDGTATDETIYFKVKAESCGYKVKINLNEADCKESIIMRIPQHGFDNSKQEEWLNSWQDMTNKIGNKLNDSNWESKYSLCHTKRRDSIGNVQDFSSVFKNFASDDQIVDFRLKVEWSSWFFSFFLVVFVVLVDVKPLFQSFFVSGLSGFFCIFCFVCFVCV